MAANPYRNLLLAKIRSCAGPRPNVVVNKDPMKTSRKHTRFNAGGAAALAFGGLFAFALGARPTRQTREAGGGKSANMINDNEQATINNMHKLSLWYKKRAEAAGQAVKQLEETMKLAMVIQKKSAVSATETSGAVQTHVAAYLKN